VLRGVPLIVSFHRYLAGHNLVQWNDLVHRILHVQLNDSECVFKWNLYQHGNFTVHSLYMALINNGVLNMNKTI
jgi:hypothetical protein